MALRNAVEMQLIQTIPGESRRLRRGRPIVSHDLEEMFNAANLATVNLDPNIQTLLEEMYSQSSLITWALEVPHKREIRQRFQFICYSLLYRHPPDGVPASHLIEVYIHPCGSG
eukprot:1776928-Prymnesium_polylepis.1